MGKIFGISDLPVTIFTTPLESYNVKQPLKGLPRMILGERMQMPDSFTLQRISIKDSLASKILRKIRKVI